MIKFNDFVKKFQQFKHDNNISTDYNSNRAYFWRFGSIVKDTYQPYLEQVLKDATQEEIDGFREMFEQGHDLLGHMVGIPLVKPTTINFYKLTVNNCSITIPNMLTSYIGNILPNNNFTVTDPTDGTLIQPPLIIYPESLKFSNGDFDGRDVLASKTSGTIMGEGFYDDYRNTNRLNNIAIFGSIDYHTSKIDMMRSDSRNDALIAEYENFIQSYAGGTDDGSTGISRPQTPLYRSDYTLNFNRFDNPVSLIWTLDIE